MLLIVAVEHFIYHIYMLCMKYMYLRFGHCHGESIIEKVYAFKIVKMKNAKENVKQDRTVKNLQRKTAH